MPGAYAHLNLRINPFGELPAAVRGELAVVDTAPLVASLRRPRTAIQLVGHCGRGKSTHLLALHHAMPDASYTRLWTDRTVPTGLSSPILLIDEIDAVWIWQRAKLMRRATSVAIAVHADRSLELRALGFQVQAVHVRSTSRDRLRQIVDRRIEHARLGPGPVPSVSDATLDTLIARHGDHVRAMEGPLYNAIQNLTEIGHVQV